MTERKGGSYSGNDGNDVLRTSIDNPLNGLTGVSTEFVGGFDPDNGNEAVWIQRAVVPTDHPAANRGIVVDRADGTKVVVLHQTITGNRGLPPNVSR